MAALPLPAATLFTAGILRYIRGFDRSVAMRAFIGIVLASCILFSAAPAPAQDAPPEQPDILVTGPREFEEQVRDFIGALTPTRPQGQTIERFEWAVCPAARGLSAAQNERVTARLRVVAQAARIPLGRPGCQPNALLVVTEDKGEFIRTLAQRRPESFGDLEPIQIRRLARSPGPSAAWQLKGLVDADGEPILVDGDGLFVNRTTRGSSRLRPDARFVFEGTVLVVERRALDGLTVTQLADFGAMRLYARTDPTRTRDSRAPTILNILDAPMGSAIPVTLTEWDLAFLRGLYASPENLYVAGQRSAIAREVSRDLRGAPTPTRD